MTSKIENDGVPAIDPKLPREEQELLAAKRIAACAQHVEAVEGDLAKARREWNEHIAKRKASLKAAIETGSSVNADPKDKLNAILQEWQDLEELEAGRKNALAELLDRKKKARAQLRISFDGARQMELDFSGSLPKDPVEDDEDEDAEAAE